MQIVKRQRQRARTSGIDEREIFCKDSPAEASLEASASAACAPALAASELAPAELALSEATLSLEDDGRTSSTLSGLWDVAESCSQTAKYSAHGLSPMYCWRSPRTPGPKRSLAVQQALLSNKPRSMPCMHRGCMECAIQEAC